MSKTTAIKCDELGCGEVFTGEGWAATWKNARAAGWTRINSGAPYRHRCPSCARRAMLCADQEKSKALAWVAVVAAEDHAYREESATAFAFATKAAKRADMGDYAGARALALCSMAFTLDDAAFDAAFEKYRP